MPGKVSAAQLRATAKYEKAKLDHIHLRLQKGKKQIIQDHAAARGESVNGFVSRAIDEAMERDNRAN